MSADNFRARVLRPAVAQANKSLVGRDQAPLPQGITPHSLRRTFASVLYALGEDPGVVMDEMGHTDPALALRVYRQAMRRGEDEEGGAHGADGGSRPPTGCCPSTHGYSESAAGVIGLSMAAIGW